MTAPASNSAMAAAIERARQRAPTYHQTLRYVAEEVGATIARDDGVTIENSVKSHDSLADKVRRLNGEAVDELEDLLLDVNDFNRYTLILDERDYATKVEQAQQLLGEQGLVFAYGRNKWEDPIYKGYNATFDDPAHPHPVIAPDKADADSPRHPVEVQFHTSASFAAKEDNHDLYRLGRSGTLDEDEEAAANELQAQRTELVSVPVGATHLEDPVPPGQRRPNIDPGATERVERKLATLRAQTERREADVAAALGSPEAAAETVAGPDARPPDVQEHERRRLTPERSAAGQRDRAGTERAETGHDRHDQPDAEQVLREARRTTGAADE